MERIAFITDLHLDEQSVIDKGVDARKNWKHILNDLTSRNIDQVILGGDLGEPESHTWLRDSLKDYKFNILLGNHDQFEEVSKHFDIHSFSHTELYYSHEDDHIKYLFLDSSSASISNDQFLWFENELATDKNVVVFIHHPVLEIETPIDPIYPLNGREKINQALQQCKKNVLVFCGHYHMDDERKEGRITQYVTPAASFQITKNAPAIETDNSFFGYRIISIDKDNVNSEVILYKSGVFVPPI